MKYDDASWHSDGDFPKDLPGEAGATHTGMFLAWAFLCGLAGEIHTEETPEALAALRDRLVTPGTFFLQQCDGKFTDEDLNDEGNEFAAVYFEFENGQYLRDYDEVLSDELETMYHVPDTWSSFDKLAPVLDQRLADWRCRKV